MPNLKRQISIRRHILRFQFYFAWNRNREFRNLLTAFEVLLEVQSLFGVFKPIFDHFCLVSKLFFFYFILISKRKALFITSFGRYSEPTITGGSETVFCRWEKNTTSIFYLNLMASLVRLNRYSSTLPSLRYRIPSSERKWRHLHFTVFQSAPSEQSSKAVTCSISFLTLSPNRSHIKKTNNRNANTSN